MRSESTSSAGPTPSMRTTRIARRGVRPLLTLSTPLAYSASVAVRRFGPRPVWSLASFVTGGALLCNTKLTLPPACVSDKGHLFDHIEEELTHETRRNETSRSSVIHHPARRLMSR